MTIVRLDTVSQIILGIIAVMQIGLLAAIAGGLYIVVNKLKTIVSDTVNETLEKTLPKIQPVLDNVTHVTGQVNDIVQKVAPHVEKIAADSENTVHSVSTKVKTTSNLVTENVAKPVVNIASILTGVQKGLEVWKTAKDGADEHDDDLGNGAAKDREAVVA